MRYFPESTRHSLPHSCWWGILFVVLLGPEARSVYFSYHSLNYLLLISHTLSDFHIEWLLNTVNVSEAVQILIQTEQLLLSMSIQASWLWCVKPIIIFIMFLAFLSNMTFCDLGGLGGTIDLLLLLSCWLWMEEMRASSDCPLLALFVLATLLLLLLLLLTSTSAGHLESEGRVRRVYDPESLHLNS